MDASNTKGRLLGRAAACKNYVYLSHHSPAYALRMVDVRAGVAMIVLGVMAGGAAGCSDGTAPPRTVTITIRPLASESSFPLLAFRDGIDAAWQTLNPTGGGRYQIIVHGP
jgi:hypothetical protein